MASCPGCFQHPKAKTQDGRTTPLARCANSWCITVLSWLLVACYIGIEVDSGFSYGGGGPNGSKYLRKFLKFSGFPKIREFYDLLS